jgi:hypothetical protein
MGDISKISQTPYPRKQEVSRLLPLMTYQTNSLSFIFGDSNNLITEAQYDELFGVEKNIFGSAASMLSVYLEFGTTSSVLDTRDQ